MRYVADIWLYWCAIAVGLVTVKYVGQSWDARIAKRDRERSDRAYSELLADLVVGNVQPRVTAWVYKTPQGNELRWNVRAHCEFEAAEILSQSFCDHALDPDAD